MITEFVRGAAHDLRHLICTVQLTAEMLEQHSDPNVAKKAQRILRSLEKATDVCSEFTRQSANANATLINVSAFLRSTADQANVPDGIELGVECPEDLSATAVEAQLFRSVFNLTLNALQAVDAHGGSSVILRGRALDRRLVITVEDDGPGLPGAIAEGQLPSGPNRNKSESSGLGLHVVTDMCQRMGGYLKVLRTGPAGTVFGIVLPLDGQALLTPEASSDPDVADLLAS